MTRAALVSAGILFVLTGCTLLENISPQTRLTDLVYEANNELRWGRVDLASMRVAGTFRARFIAQHRRWGREVAIADMEITNLEMGVGGSDSASYVTVHWVDQRSMELHETTLRQLWASQGESWLIVGEEIIGGSTGLLVDPTIPAGLTTDDHGELIPDLEGAGGEAELISAAGDESIPDPEAPTPSSGRSAPIRRDAQGIPY